MSNNIKISKIKNNPNNPRNIEKNKYLKLLNSIKEFPEMMSKRPMVCVTDKEDGKIYPLGGNMRLKALKELEYKEIPNEWIVMADDWDEEKRKEFILKDNFHYGDWDLDILSDNYDNDFLQKIGLDINFSQVNNDQETVTEDILEEPEQKEIQFFERTHILISLPPQKLIEIQEDLQKIIEKEYVEYEQSSN